MSNSHHILPRHGLRSPMVIRKSSLIAPLFVIAMIGVHLRLTLYSGSTALVPYYLLLFSAAALGLMFRNELLRKAGTPMFFLAAFVLIQPILSTAPGGSYLSRIPSLLSFIASIISALCFYVALQKLPRARFRRLVFGLWFVFIALAVIESLGMKPVFDGIREALYSSSGRGIYIAEDRDLGIYGKIRPAAFASEPSFLSYTLAILLFLSFVTNPRPRSASAFLKSGLMLAVSFLVSPSFTYVFFVFALLVWSFWPGSRQGYLLLMLLGATAAAVALLFQQTLAMGLLGILGGHAETGSFFGRIVVAPLTGLKVLTEWPLFGVGLGNSEAARPAIIQLWNDTGAFSLFPWFNDPAMRAQDLMSNGFWWQWIYLGCIGGAIFTGLWFWMLRRIGIEYPGRSILCCWIIWYPGAAFVDAGTWIILTIVSLSPGTLLWQDPLHPVCNRQGTQPSV